MSKIINAFKGFNSDMTCLGKQYKEGEIYVEESAEVCKCGMHACENPLDLFHYYQISKGAKYHKVKCSGETSYESGKDSKLACTNLEIGAEIKLADIIKIGISMIWEKVKHHNTGAASGKNSIAVANGYNARVKGAIGCYLITTEYTEEMELLHCKVAYVDGEKIKADTLYMLKNGEFVEVEECNS